MDVRKLDFLVAGEPIKARVWVDANGESKTSLSGLSLPAVDFLTWDTVEELARMFAEIRDEMTSSEVASSR